MLSSALHALRRHVGANVAIVLTLAVTTAALLAALAIAHNFFVAPWPYDTARLTVLSRTARDAAQPAYTASAAEYRAIRDQGGFAAVSASSSRPVAIAGADGLPRRVTLTETTPNAVAVTATAPLLGRFVAAAADDGLVISHDFWQQEFGGRADVLGASLLVDRVSRPVVGVMPPRFQFMGADLWAAHAEAPDSSARPDRRYVLNALLADNDDIDAARVRLATLSARLAREGERDAYPEGFAFGIDRVIDAVMGAMRPTVFVFVTAALLMLLVALGNVATLMQVRVLADQARVATVMAIGATRRRLLAETLVGNAVLAGVGVAAGWLLGAALFRHLVGFISNDWIPRELEGQFVYGSGSLPWLPVVALVVSILLTASQWSQLTGMRADMVLAMREGGRGGVGAQALRQGRLLAGFQVVAAGVVGVVALCVGAGLAEVRARPLGLAVDDTVSLGFALPADRYPDQLARQAFVDRLRERVGAETGVAALALADTPPFQRYTRQIDASAASARGVAHSAADLRAVDARYAETLGLRLRHGRFVDDALDRPETAAVAVVSVQLAERLFGDDAAVGRSLRLANDAPGVQRTIVGVVEDARFHGVAKAAPATVLVPLWQQAALPSTFTLLLRGSPGRAVDVAAVQRLAAEIDPWAPLYWPESLAARSAEGLSGLRLAELVFNRFALLAIALAAFSLFVVLMFLVAQRRREYAVRAAVGATPRRLFLGVLGEGGRIGAVGLVVGMALAYAAMQMVDAALEGAVPWRVGAVAVVAAVLLLAALASSAWPAWRALRVPASEVLRG